MHIQIMKLNAPNILYDDASITKVIEVPALKLVIMF